MDPHRPGRLEIADPVQAALQGAIAAQFATSPAGINYAFLNRLLSPYLATAQAINLGLERNRLLARLDLGRHGPPLLGARVRPGEAHAATAAYGGSFGFSNATELPEPIDYDTTGAELAGEWNTATSGLAFGYRYSKFENNVSTLIWDNPFRATSATDPSAYTAPGAGSIGGSALGFADLAASNRADLLFLNGRTRFGSWFANGSASYDTMKQDDPLLPYTLNSSIVGINVNGATFDPTNPANLPVRTRRPQDQYDGAQRRSRHPLRPEPRPHLPLSLLRSRQQGARASSSPATCASTPSGRRSGASRCPTPTRGRTPAPSSAGTSPRATRLGFAFERESWDRKFREVRNSDENIWKATFDTRPDPLVRAAVELSVRRPLDRALRRGGRRGQLHRRRREPTNLPDLRKFDEAARKRHLFNVQGQFFPSDAWSFFVGVTGNDQKYEQEPVRSAEGRHHHVQRRAQLRAGRQLQPLPLRRPHGPQGPSRRAGSPAPRPRPARSTTGRRTSPRPPTPGAPGSPRKLASRWTLDLSANWSRSDGKADLFSPPGGTPDVAVGFDNYDDIKLFSLLGRLDYQINNVGQGGPLRPLGGLHDRQLRAPGPAELPARSAAAQSELRRLPGQHRRARHDPHLLSAVRAALFRAPPWSNRRERGEPPRCSPPGASPSTCPGSAASPATR